MTGLDTFERGSQGPTKSRPARPPSASTSSAWTTNGYRAQRLEVLSWRRRSQRPRWLGNVPPLAKCVYGLPRRSLLASRSRMRGTFIASPQQHSPSRLILSPARRCAWPYGAARASSALQRAGPSA